MSNTGFTETNSDILNKLKLVETRLAKLEKAVFHESTDSNGLKVKSFDGNTVDSRNQSAGSQESISPEKREELMKQIDVINGRQKESKEMLDELMNEN